MYIMHYGNLHALVMMNQNCATRFVNSDTVQDTSNRLIFLVNNSTLTGFHDIELYIGYTRPK